MNRLSVSVISNTSIADGVVQVDINDLTAKGQCCMHGGDIGCPNSLQRVEYYIHDII